MIFQDFRIERQLLAPLEKSCSGLSSAMNREMGDDDRMTQILIKWKKDIADSISKIKIDVQGNPSLTPLIVKRSDNLAANIRLCLSQLESQETHAAKRRMPRGATVPDPVVSELLYQLRDTKNILAQSKEIFPVDVEPAVKPEVTEVKPLVTKVTKKTVTACLSNLVFGLPVRQLLSEILFSATWSLKKSWDFAIKSLSWNMLKTAGAAVPCILGVLAWAMVSMPVAVIKKFVVDMPKAFMGIFKPQYWMKTVNETRLEESSEWLEKAWFNVVVWGEKWIDWVFSQN